ncbi:MAG: sporulation protein YqfD [Clostridia bacterium]|nr:sporulation protein YqfD [Clostridia bacterium]
MRRGLDVRFQVRGLSGEKLLNAARNAQIPLRGVSRSPGRSLTIRCAAADYEALKALAAEKGFAVGEARPVGWLKRLKQMKRRWALLGGAVLCVGLMIYALGFVWQVRIENAGAYEGEVRSFLRQAGIVPGVRKSQVRLGALRDQLEWYLPQVKWVRTAWQGVALRVSLEEGTPPPEIESAGAPGDIVAAEDGLITLLTTYAGTPQVKNGDFVRAGQVLIAGKEQGPDGTWTAVKARGQAQARVWITQRVRLPLTEYRSVPTGRQETRRVLKAPFFAWSAQEAPDYLTSDRLITETAVGGAWLPVTLQRESYAEVALQAAARDPREALREAEGAALRLLNQRLKKAETVDKWINFRMIEGDTIVVEAAGEIRREIGRYQKTSP